MEIMARKKAKKEVRQLTLFDITEPTPLHVEVGKQVMQVDDKQVEAAAASQPRPRILIGSTKSCPVCGEDIKLTAGGTVHCTKCWWWQGVNE